MTSALLGSWADSGLKVPLGPKRPSGLGPPGPVDRSPLSLPGFVTTTPKGALGPRCSPMGRGATYGPTGLLDWATREGSAASLMRTTRPRGGTAFPPATASLAARARARVRWNWVPPRGRGPILGK
jgi:hypothetical protein